MGFANPIVGGTALRIPAIQSPNYSPGVAGWIVDIDGSAEFNNLTVRGTFQGSRFIINMSGIFLYSGTPAAGNLIGSWAPAAGTDAFGNTYQAGLTILGVSTAINLLGEDITLTASNGTTAVLESGSDAALYLKPNTATGPWFAGGAHSTVAGGNHPGMILFSPADTTNGAQSTITMEGSSTADNRTFILAQATFMSLTGDLHLFGTGQVQNWAVKQDGSGNPYTWQTPTYNTNWAGSTTFNGGANWHTLQYRLDAEDNLWVIGGFKAVGAVGSTVFTLPAAYRPKAQWPGWMQQNNAGAVSVISAEIGASGNFNMIAANGAVLANGNEWLVNVKIPMGNMT